MKRTICILLAFLLCLPVLAGGEGGGSVSYLYTFTPGSLLGGEGMETVRELMEALQIHAVIQNDDGEKAAQIRLLSEGEEAFSVVARKTAGDEYLVSCSLLGDNVFRCRREQLGPAMLTMVKMMEDMELLKGENVEKVNNLVLRFVNLLDDYLDRPEESAGDAGINLTPYTAVLSREASSVEEEEPSAEEKETLGAVKKTVYRLDEETRRELFPVWIQKVLSIPVVGSRLKRGELKVAGTVITEEQLQALFVDPEGETTVELVTDGQDRPVRLNVYVPDLSDTLTDPDLQEIRGAEVLIRRTDGENEERVSITTLRLTGLEGDLLTIRMDREPGDPVPAVPGDKVHDVGEMDSGELQKLVNSMKIEFLLNAANMILVLPRCVFDMLGSRIFGR